MARGNPVKWNFKKEISKVGKPIKLIIGGGGIGFAGWLSSEIRQLNILDAKDWRMVKRKKISHILAEHVWEHLTLEDGRVANGYCYKYLAKGGRLRIAVPDGFFPNQSYIDYVKPGGSGAGADDHKVLYNYKLLKEELQKLGFRVELLEYWDEDGFFHAVNWRPEDGMIRRSKRFDQRNADGHLRYTSLIVDAIKP